jgi:hypothetical protein
MLYDLELWYSLNTIGDGVNKVLVASVVKIVLNPVI